MTLFFLVVILAPVALRWTLSTLASQRSVSCKPVQFCVVVFVLVTAQNGTALGTVHTFLPNASPRIATTIGGETPRSRGVTAGTVHSYDDLLDSATATLPDVESTSPRGNPSAPTPYIAITSHKYDPRPTSTTPLQFVATKASAKCPGNSFRSDTEVVMADGSRKPISELKIGDKVVATDPETGLTAVRAVTAVHLNLDTELADLTVVDADGDVSVIHTTQHHPFWNVADGKWTDVIDLNEGDRLRSVDGSLLTVVGLRAFTGQQWMWDLTIDDIHTFYVANGDEPKLVHNCFGLDDLSAAGQAPAKGGQTAAGRAYQKHMDRGELLKVPGSQLGSAGQNLLDDILTAPGTRVVNVTSGNFAGGVRYVRPDGVGVTFDSAGRLQYFGVGY